MTANVITQGDQKCYGVRFSSSLFNQAFTEHGTLSLEYTINCGETIKIDFDTNGTPITYYDILDPSDKVCDGIYCGKLSYMAPESPNKIIEYASTFVSCDTECKIYDLYEKDRSTASMVLYYDVIKLAMQCDTCDCKKACALFKELEKMIGGNETSINMDKFIKVEDCGCNKSN